MLQFYFRYSKLKKSVERRVTDRMKGQIREKKLMLQRAASQYILKENELSALLVLFFRRELISQ